MTFKLNILANWRIVNVTIYFQVNLIEQKHKSGITEANVGNKL